MPPTTQSIHLSLNKKRGVKSFLDYYFCMTQKVREFSFFSAETMEDPLWESFLAKPEITEGGVKRLLF
jgi:hypothetical protein